MKAGERMTCLIILLCWTVLISLCCSVSVDDILATRIAQITARKSWRVKYTLPTRYLDRALTIHGDDTRMRLFVEKLIRGENVSYAIMGGSISTFRGAPLGPKGEVYKDMTWHGMFHKWLDYTFTPCGDFNSSSPLKEAQDIRYPMTDQAWHTLRVCPLSHITLHNLGIGATSSIFAEKCLFQAKLPKDVDLVILEYTANALLPERPYDPLDSSERRAYERLLRKVLRLPKRPAVLMLHMWNTLDRGKFAMIQEDFHNAIGQNYGNVQALSVRAVVFPFSKHYLRDVPPDWNSTLLPNGKMSSFNPLSHIGLYEFDGLHPTGAGQHMYADILIRYVQRMTTTVIGEFLARKVFGDDVMGEMEAPLRTLPAPSVPKYPMHHMPAWFTQFAEGPAASYHTTSPESDVTEGQPMLQLPEPLFEGNYEDSDGFCLAGSDLNPHVTSSQGWTFRAESAKKYGWISDIPHSALRIKIDTTISGSLPAEDAAASASAAAAVPSQVAQAGLAGVGGNAFMGLPPPPPAPPKVEVQIGYLKTYENIGTAMFKCASGCSCAPTLLDGQWTHRHSTPFYQGVKVTPHPECVVEVVVSPVTKTGSHKFKVTGLVVSKAGFWLKEAGLGNLQDNMESTGAHVNPLG